MKSIYCGDLFKLKKILCRWICILFHKTTPLFGHCHFEILRFGKTTLHPKFEEKKHFSPLTFDLPNFIKLILKMLCTNLPFA